MRLGIDLGGTKTELVVIDENHQVLWRQRLPSARLPQTSSQTAPSVEDLHHAYQQTLAIIAQLLKAAGDDIPQTRSLPLGMGTPGSETAQGHLRNCNSIWLNGRPLRRDLEQYIQRPVRLANDANCFALAEARMGAAQGADSVFGVILGTGVGGGLVLKGELHSGINHIAGEWGHNRLPVALPVGERGAQEIPETLQQSLQQRPCYCGRINCIETYLSGPGLSRSYFALTQESLSAEMIADRQRTGESAAQQVWQHYQQQLARSLAQVINVVDPEVVVLGGGLSQARVLYEQIPRLWAPYVFSEVVQTRLLQAKLGDSAGVFGAAWLW